MNDNLQFSFEDHRVRVVFDADGSPWWVGLDVCVALGIQNSRDALGRVPGDEKGVDKSDTLGGPQLLTIVNEAGLYRLVFQSRKPAAERFKRWIAHEVLPSLRRTGRYEMTDVASASDEELPADYDGWLALISEARRTHGRAAARKLWDQSPLPEVTTQLRGLLDMNAAMEQFVNEYCELDPKSRTIVRTCDLLGRYNEIAVRRRWPLATRNSGARALNRAMPVPRVRSNGLTGFRGVRLI